MTEEGYDVELRGLKTQTDRNPEATVTTEDAQTDAVDAPDVSVQDASEVRGRQRQFGKLTPSQAASLRWEKERARQASAEDQAAHEARGVTVVVRTTVPVGEIISKLAGQAKKGDVAAARELRAYMAEAHVETETDLSALDRRTLQALKARLLQEIADEQGIETFEYVEEVATPTD